MGIKIPSVVQKLRPTGPTGPPVLRHNLLDHLEDEDDDEHNDEDEDET